MRKLGIGTEGIATESSALTRLIERAMIDG
jgi:hypothetical protein